MSYRFEAGRIYRMPTHFGSAPGPRQLPDGFVLDPRHSPRRLRPMSTRRLLSPTQRRFVWQQVARASLKSEWQYRLCALAPDWDCLLTLLVATRAGRP